MSILWLAWVIYAVVEEIHKSWINKLTSLSAFKNDLEQYGITIVHGEYGSLDLEIGNERFASIYEGGRIYFASLYCLENGTIVTNGMDHIELMDKYSDMINYLPSLSYRKNLYKLCEQIDEGGHLHGW